MTNQEIKKEELEEDLKALEAKGGVPAEVGRKAVKEVKVEKAKVSRKVAKKAVKKLEKKAKKSERKHKADRDEIKKDLKKMSLKEVAKKHKISYSLAWVLKTGYIHPKK